MAATSQHLVKPIGWAKAITGVIINQFALPGFGSLMAKRAVGYFQAPLSVLGLMLTFTFGLRFVAWFFAN